MNERICRSVPFLMILSSLLFDWSIFIDHTILCIRAICHISRLSHGNICHWRDIVNKDEKNYAGVELLLLFFLRHQIVRRTETLSSQVFIFFVYILKVDGTSANTEAEIISTQNEIITYVNHTAKLSCIIQNKNRQHVILHFLECLPKSNSPLLLGHMVTRDIHEWNPEINQSSIRWSFEIYSV